VAPAERIIGCSRWSSGPAGAGRFQPVVSREFVLVQRRCHPSRKCRLQASRGVPKACAIALRRGTSIRQLQERRRRRPSITRALFDWRRVGGTSSASRCWDAGFSPRKPTHAPTRHHPQHTMLNEATIWSGTDKSFRNANLLPRPSPTADRETKCRHHNPQLCGGQAEPVEVKIGTPTELQKTSQPFFLGGGGQTDSPQIPIIMRNRRPSLAT